MISFLYYILIKIRNYLYDHKIFAIYKSSIPVISVGNITSGGTGKTPFVIYLTKLFFKRGLTPLIISRGYKRTSREQLFFNGKSNLTVNCVGDEPFLISKKIPKVDIIINKNRVDAVKYAENVNKKYDVIILDDAFQHRSIDRDLDIVLINTTQTHTHLLPYGTLREPYKNISRADCVILTKNNSTFNTHSLESFKIPILKCEEKYALSNNKSEGVGFCGIGSPSSFWKTLESLSVNLHKKIEFKDHQDYTPTTIESIKNLLIDDDTFFTTEKDWVKLPKRLIEKYNGIFVEMSVKVKSGLFNKMIDKICHLD